MATGSAQCGQDRCRAGRRGDAGASSQNLAVIDAVRPGRHAWITCLVPPHWLAPISPALATSRSSSKSYVVQTVRYSHPKGALRSWVYMWCQQPHSPRSEDSFRGQCHAY
jgi:hypothetical protein